MRLTEYAEQIRAILDATPFVTGTSLSYEERPPSAGLIKGSVLFIDGSELAIREFLLTQPSLVTIKYAYHYRSGEGLIFRIRHSRSWREPPLKEKQCSF